ncbi:hypothetical protein C8F01DRAFT_1120140 [Mycena amicta]|nr:hypothetical protein C8F01DRAFT_1120140 [Mycena amicta]
MHASKQHVPLHFIWIRMVFCVECGTPGDGRFCSECGTRLDSGGPGSTKFEPPPYPYAEVSSGGVSSSSSTSAMHTGGLVPQRVGGQPNIRGVAGTSQGGTSASAVAATAFISQPPANAPFQQQSPTALFGSQGFRLSAFHLIARELFIKLDQTTFPVGTQLMEASKIRRFREVAGRPISPYFESHVLPMYYQTLGAQLAGNNVLTWEGWNTYLAHKILATPDEMYAHIGAALRGLNIQLPWPLLRSDFPEYAYPDASARELQFQQGIRDLAGAALAGGGGSARVARHSLTGLLATGFLFN